jgi:hypothetical protein
MFKWEVAADAGASLNDGWYVGTLRRRTMRSRRWAGCCSRYRDGQQWVEEDDGALHIGAGLR